MRLAARTAASSLAQAFPVQPTAAAVLRLVVPSAVISRGLKPRLSRSACRTSALISQPTSPSRSLHTAPVALRTRSRLSAAGLPQA
jgi:hypothetical protein